jgi:cysteinyl-tRNA synthetase
MLKFYNTLSRKIEEIEKKDHLNLYTCGPTVYNFAHIGNLRSFILADLLYRTLKYEGYNPHWVMNITDIDDKTIKGTLDKYGKNAGLKGLHDFTEEYYQAFLTDLREVNVSVDDIEFIRVTDKMKEIQEFIVGLLDKGYAYKAEDDSTYFSIEKYQKDFGDYGQLVGEKFLEGKKNGARVKVDEYEKDNLSDFALWKAHSTADGNIFWDHSLLGKGRPGWHIECSAINHVAFKGEPTDIHTGGVDLIFPHHTNEIAQSQALLGKGNFVKHWFHSEHLLVDGKKMAKKLNNFYMLKDLGNENPIAGISFRSLMLSAHYQSQMNFLMEQFKKTNRLIVEYASEENKIYDEVVDAVNDNLNIPKAVGLSFKLYNGEVHPAEIFGLNSGKIKEFQRQRNDPDLSPEAKKLLDLRNIARKEKDFKKSDELRKKIEELGYEVMDTPEGQKIRKK